MRRALPGTDAGIPCEKRAGPASEVKVCAAVASKRTNGLVMGRSESKGSVGERPPREGGEARPRRFLNFSCWASVESIPNSGKTH